MDFAFINRKKPNMGNVLISDPFLDEDYFRRSVVLLCEHNIDGTFGFVLNNYLNLNLNDLDVNFPRVPSRISIGGPVDTQNLFFIHTFKDKIDGSSTIDQHLSFGGDFEQILDLLRADPEKGNQIRFFLGYSGWSLHQLERELDENSWIVANNISVSEILDTSMNNLWTYCIEKQGERFKTISKFPLNPNDN